VIQIYNSNSLTSILLILISCVVLVNGFTDAPNSISGIVSSGIWSKRKACLVSGALNLFGVAFFTLTGGKVAQSVVNLTDFGKSTYYAVSACLIGVILFSLITWAFAMPSSESHALLSCILGARLATSGKIPLLPLVMIVLYTVLSCTFALLLALLTSVKIKKDEGECAKFEKLTCMLSSFCHGAQDGQKFIALYVALLFPSADFSPSSYFILSLTVGVLMMVGTLFGGGKIIDSLGNDIVKCDAKIAFSSDIASTSSVFLCSVFGFSVSTGNIKACSLIGAGLGCGKRINYKTVKKIIISSALTFPACLAMGLALTKLFIFLF